MGGKKEMKDEKDERRKKYTNKLKEQGVLKKQYPEKNIKQ